MIMASATTIITLATCVGCRQEIVVRYFACAYTFLTLP